MPDKKYLIEIPDMPEGSGIWEADKWERNKDAFMKENPTAKVFEMGAYDAEDTNENDQIFISMDDEESSGVWDSDKWERNKDAFMQENPTAQISRVRYQDYWGDRAAAIENRLAELDQPDQERAARLAEIGYFDDSENEVNLDINLKPVSQAMKVNSASGDVEYLDPAVEEFFANDDAYTQKQLEKNQLKAEYDTNPTVIAQREWEAKRKEAEKAYRGELKQQITEDYDANVDKNKAARGGIEIDGVPVYGPASFEAEKQDKYLAALQLLDFADRMEKGEKFWEGVGYGATKAAVDYDGKEMQQVGLVFKKLEDRGVNINEATEEQIDEALDPEDKALMRAYLEYEKAMYEADPSRAFKGGAQFGETIPFIMEFVATGNIYKAGAKKTMELAGKKAIGKGFAKWIAKSAGKKIPTLMKQGVAKATTGTIKALGGTLARTVASPTTYTKMGTPDIQISDQGDVSVETHAAREFFDHYIENLSEISGEGMVAGLGGAAKLLKSTKIGKMPFMKLGEWLGNKAVWQGLSKLGAQSLPIEVAEEVVGNALRYITGVDKDALSRMFDKDEFASMVIGFAPLTVLGMGTSAAAMGAVNIGAATAANKMRQALSPFYTEEQIDAVTGSLERAKTSDDIVAALKPILVGMHDATQDEKTAVMDYAIKVAKKKAMISARNFQEMQLSDAAIRQVEDKVGRFWIENEDKSRTVRQVDLNDGRQVFVVSQPNEAGEVAIIEVETGKKGMAKLSDIKQEIFNSSLESYGTRFVMADRKAKERERMLNERQVQINLVRQNLSAQNGKINLGTEGAPIMVVVDAESEAGVRYVAQNGSTGTLTWEAVADAMGTPIIVKTDAQLAQEEAAAIVARDAERRAARAQQDAVGIEEVTEAAEEVENAANQLDEVHIPKNEDGSVNEAAFWEQNPEAYVQWNDEQQQDGGVDSLEQIISAKNELSGLLGEAQAAQQTSDPMQRKAAKAEVQRLSEKINTLTALEQKYVEALKTPEQKRQDVEERIKTRAKEWADKTGVEINIVENLSQVKNAEARAAMAIGQKVFAWAENGKTYMYLPAIESVEQLDEKFAHEVVAHIGLRALLGDGYNALLDRVWDSMSDATKRRYANYGTVRGDQRSAADEYLAHIAEKMGSGVASVQEFNEEEKTVWQSIVDFVKEAFSKIFGNSATISEEEIADLIRASYQNLEKQTTATDEATEKQRAAISNLMDALTPEEAVEVAENDYQIAAEALNELKGNQPKIEKGESSASYIERKKAYNESLREAQAKADAARAVADEIKKMYIRHTTDKQSVETAEASQVAELSDTQTTSSMIAPTTSSEGKDSNKIESATSSEEEYEPGDPPAINSNANKQAEGNTLFSVEDGSLVGMHNISEEKLKKVIKQGGMANPSTAVIDISSQSFTSYGDISLVMPSSLVDAKSGRNAGTFTADAWTPVYPQVSKRFSNDKGQRRYWKDIAAIPEEMQGEARQGFDGWTEDRNSSGLAYMFLLERNEAPEMVRVPVRFSDVLKDDLLAILGEDRDNLYKLSDEEKQAVLNLYIQQEFNGNREAFDESIATAITRIEDRLSKGKVPSFVEKRITMDLQWMKEHGYNYENLSKFVDDIIRDIRHAGEVNAAATTNLAIDYIRDNNLVQEFELWKESLDERYGIKEYLWGGYTPSGNQRWLPNTIENASKLMNQQGLAGAVGITASFNRFVATLAPKVKSLSDIKSSKGRLVEDEKLVDEFRDKWSEVFYDLGVKCQPDARGYEDYGLARLIEAAQKKNPGAYLKKEYNVELSKEDLQKLSEMISAIKNDFPARYFETKFQRPVYLNEFAAAVMPTTTSDDVKKAVSEAGLPIYEYDSDVKGARAEATRKAADIDGVRFSYEDAMPQQNTMFSVVTPEVREEMDRIAANAIIDGNYMLAPNGQPTNLTADQWALVRTEDFTNWFGDWINDPENASKILDENGEPMVMYHGSAWEPLLEPKGEAVFRMNDGLLGKGAYFSNNLTEATAYAEIATDLDMTEEGNYELLQDKYVTDYFLNIRNEKDIYRQGGDIIAVAKSPNQIKSATDNNGEFSESSDIRFSLQEEGQSSEDFHNAVLDDFKRQFNVIAPTTVVRVEDRAALAEAIGVTAEDLTDDMYQKFVDGVDRGGAAFYADKTNRIVIFALDRQTRSAEIDDNIFHENTHAMIDKHPELLELGQWLWDNADRGMRRTIKEDILSKNYPEWQYANEMLSKFTGNVLAMGRAGEVLNMLPADQKKHWELILKEFGYEPEREDGRRLRGFDLDAARAGVPATQPKQTVSDNGTSARYSAEERRVINELFPGAIQEDTRFSAEEAAPEDYTRFSVVTDPALIEELENSPKIKVYRAMQLIDGELYPPMSAKVEGKLREPIKLGQWEQAEERPDLIDSKGNFKLDKANKASVPARYNPYFHTSRTPLNDQFSSAQSRPNLVTVEVEIPESELTSGYKADKAKDSVGEKEWKAGVIQGKLSGTRKVILSRWDKPVRIVPDSEVAAEIVKMFEGKDIVMPSNVVTPSLRAELEKLGVPFVETDNNGKPVNKKNSLLDVVKTLFTKGKQIASQMFSQSFFDVVETPEFMKQYGLTGDKFTVRYGVIARHFGKDGSHDLSEKDWNLLPSALQNPFAITKIKGEDKAFRIYTSLQTSEGEYVVVGVDVKNAGRDLEVNAISTLFGRRSNANLTQNEEVIYQSKDITPEQSSLLKRPNSSQYPTEQELSDNKDSYNSENSNTLFSLDTETEIKAIKGLSILDSMNISLEQEMVITREAIDAERKRITELNKRLGDKDLPVLKKQIENAEDRLKTYLRQMEILQDVEDKLIKVEFVEPDVRTQMANMEPQDAFEYLSELLTMHLTPVVLTKVVDADGKETIVRQGGKKKGVMLTPETLEKELGYSKSDWKGISYIVSESEGMSLDAIAEMIEQDFDASHIFGSMDTMEIKSVLIDFLQSMSSYSEIRDYIKTARERMAKEETDEINGRIQQTIKEIESQYGMSIDEYNAMLIQEERSARERWLEENENPEGFAKFEQSNIEDNEQTSGKAGEASEATPGANGEGSEGGQASEGSGNVAGSGKNVENPADGGQEAGAGNNQGNGNGGENNTGDQGGNTATGVVPGNVESGKQSVDEIVESGKQKVLQQNADAADTLTDRIRAINGNLQQLRMMAAAQREYDKKTVKAIADLANELLTNGALSDMTRGEIKRLLSVIKDATGKQDLTISVDRLMDIMIGNQLRYGKDRFEEYLKIRGKKVDARGVEVRGKLDVEGQQVMDAVREGITLDLERIQDRISAAEDRLFDSSQTISRNAEHELAGLELAKQYVENIKESEAEEKDLRNELKNAKDQYDAGVMEKTAYREFVKATYDAIRENRMQRVMAYESLLNNMADMVKNSLLRAGQLRQAEKARIEKIQHFANSDMQGMPADEHKAKDSAFWNNPIVRFLLKPLATFDQMLRHFAPKSRSGEGYLWNHFMGGWLRATENEYKGIQAAHDKLDAKVKSVFGDKVKRWSDLFAIERKMPKAEISFWDAGEIKTFEVSQGNLLYIYMVNKMTDGKMKLRKMGIEEADVINIARELDPRFVELADWLQEDFLPSLREKYNAVHERLFGAPMAAIDNYFPIRVLANARSREVDINIEESNAKPSTITGNIMKRTKNSLALDVLGSDAFDVILGHINDMEKWAAFAEWNKDLNTLLSYKKFRNRVQNMSGIYGAGSVVWNNFRSVAEIAAGVYKPATKADSVDKTIMNIAKGVTGAKISFRVYTAFKQLLSWPAFISDANPVILAKNMANPAKAWNWAMENLPLFEKRWKSRQAGDSRLMQTDADWKLWKTKAVEIAGRLGMTPNALVDAVTVAIGARSVYETRVKQYLDYGYDQEKAEEKAKRDATVAFNESQQSNESAFLSQIQMDRTVASVVLTVFRNSSMGYQRMYVDALRNITRMTKKGYKAESVEYMKKQMLRDGLSEAEAERAANRIYNRSFVKNAVQALTFGFIVQLAWNLGPYLPYIFGGDDDDKKKEMATDAAVRALVGGPVEGMSGGPVLSNILGNIAMGEKLSEVNGVQLPLSSDVENLFKLFGKDNVRAVNEIFNIVIQSGIGVNPQTITDAVVAIVDACNGDLGTATEAALCLMRILQVPQSQLEDLYLDEIDFSADDALDLTIKEFAERYAKYKVSRSAPLTKWMYTDEKEKEREETFIKRFTSEAEELKRTRGNEEAKTFYQYYDNEYADVAESLRDLKRRAKDAEGAEVKAISKEADEFVKTEEFKRYDDLVGDIKAYEAYKKLLKDVTDPETRKAYEKEMLKHRRNVVNKINGYETEFE